MIQKAIRVVHYNPTFLARTETWIYSQITHLDEVAVKFYALARENRREFPFENLRYLWGNPNRCFAQWFNIVWRKILHRYPIFLPWLWKDRPDLIHAHFGPCGYHFLPCARWLKVPLITSFYGVDAYALPQRQPRWRNRYLKLFRKGRLFLAEGPAMRHKLIELGCPPEKVVVHHIGIEPGKYEFRPRKPDEEIRLMVCGRFVEKKGMPYAVEALRQVRSRTRADVRLTIVGDSDRKGTLTHQKRKILDSVREQGVSNAVTFTGYISHDKLIEELYNHHVFLAPSVHASNGDAEGGFPVILTEALATGMPVVGFSHCDIPEIVQDGKSGFLVPERDVDALAEKLEYLIEHPEIWPEMGRAGREFVEENYDIRKLNRRLVALYESLLQTEGREDSTWA